MGREIDERVVQMKFENGQFERGVQTSINSMDALRKSMNFDDAVKGFDKLDKSAKSVDMSALGSAVDTVRVKFNLLSVMAFNVMDRIAKKAIETGERMVKALTIDNINVGWDKFAEKTSAVQTIMSATASQFTDTGTQMAFVEQQLDKLNWFTDETSYNFLDMVNNIGKFTSNNVELGQAVTAMQGISTWAAKSGANINEAGRAMYNLSQAIAVGSVKLIDWKSIENANMATAEFKTAVLEAAAAEGTLQKVSEGTYRTIAKGTEINTKTFAGFNDTLQQGWFTSEVLLRTLDKYGAATNKLNEIYEALEQEVTTSDIIETIEGYSAALEKARAEAEATGLSAEATVSKVEEAGREVAQSVADEWGVTLEQATEWLNAFDNETMQFGLNAFKAAQEAKTFTDAINSVKDAVSTGWMKSFEYIFGNYLEAKELWTAVANELYDLFAESGNARNEMLKDWKEMGGHEYVVDIIVGTIQALNVLKNAIAKGLGEGFGVMNADKLMDLTKAIHGFILALIPTGETLDKLRRIARGVGSAFDILKTLVSGALNTAFRLIGAIVGDLNLDLLGFLANIGDVIFNFRNWVHESTILTDAVDRLIGVVARGRARIGEFVTAFLELPLVKASIETVQSFYQAFMKDIVTFIDLAKERFEEFFNYLNKRPKIGSLEDLIDIFKAFKKIVLDDLLDLKKRFPNVFSAFNQAAEITVAWIKALISHLGFLERPFEAIKTVISHLTTEFYSLLKGINAVDLAMIITGAGIFAAMTKVTKIFSTVAGVIESVTNLLGGFAKSFRKWTKAKSVKEYAKAIMYLAIGIKMIADVDATRAWESVFVLIALGGALIGLTQAMSMIKGGKVNAATFAALGVAILAIAGSVAILGTMGDNLLSRVQVLSGLVLGLGAVAIAINKFAPSFNGASLSIASFAIAVTILVGSLERIGRLDHETASKGLAGLVGVLTMLALAMRIMSGGKMGVKAGGADIKIGANNVIKAGTSILALAVGVRILIGALKEIAKMDTSEAFIAITEISLLMMGLAAAMRIMNKVGGESGKFKAGSTFLGLAVAMNLLVPAIRGLSTIKDDELNKAKNVIIQLGAIFVAAIASTTLGGENSHKAGLMLIEMAAAITILTVAVRALGSMDAGVLAKGTAAVAALGLVFAAAIGASAEAGQAKNAMLVMVAAITVLSYAVYELSKIPWQGLLSATGALSTLVLSLGASLKLISGMRINAKILVAIGELGAIMAAMGYVIWRMNQFGDMSNALQTGLSLAAVLAGITAAVRILKGTQAVDAKVMKNVAQLGVLAGAIGLMLSVITSVLPRADIKKALGIALAIDMLVPVLTGSMVMLSKIKMAPNKSTIRKFDEMAAVMLGVGAALFAISAIPTTDAKKTMIVILALDTLIPVMTACMYGLSKIKKSPTKATMTALTAFTGIVGGLGILIALFSTIAPADVTNAIQVVTAIDLLLPVMTGCFIALSQFGQNEIGAGTLIALGVFGVIAEALGGLAAFISSKITDMDKLIGFVIAVDALVAVLTPCMLAINKAGAVSPTLISNAAIIGAAIDVIGILVGALIALMGAVPTDLLESAAENGLLMGQAIGGFVGGIYGGMATNVMEAIAESLPVVGTGLTRFMENAQGFFDALAALDPTALRNAAYLTIAIMSLTAADFMVAVETLAGGFLNKLNDALGFDDDFADKMEAMGEAIAGFAEAAGNIDGENIKNAAQACMLLTALEQNIPAQGGALQDFLGSKDLELFGWRLQEFGGYLKTFVETVEGITEEDVNGAAAAGSAMAELEDSLPPYGGELQKWFGEKDLEDFGERMVSFGESLVSYVAIVEGITEEDVQGSANAGKIMSDLEHNLVMTGGFVSNFLFGEKNFASFGERIESFGKALKVYVKKTKDITPESVQGSAAAVGMLINLEQGVPTTGGAAELLFGSNSFEQFGKNLSALGTALADYELEVSELNMSTVNNSINAISALVHLATNITTLGNWAQNVADTIDNIITFMLREIDADQYKIKNKGTEITRWFVEGLQEGEKVYKVNAKLVGKNLGYAVDTGFCEALEIHSPSAVMAENGVWIVKGIAEGIKSDMSAEEAMEKKAQNIVQAFQNVLEESNLFRTGLSLDRQIWDLTEGKNATAEEISQRDLDDAMLELESLSNDAAAQRAALQTIMQEFGEDSKQYREASNTYKQALVQALQKKEEIDSMTQTVAIDSRTQMQTMAQIMKENAEAAKLLGWSDEQLENYAADQAGLTDQINARKRFDEFIKENKEAYEMLGRSQGDLITEAKQYSGFGIEKAATEMSLADQYIQKAMRDQQVEIEKQTAEVVSKSVRSGVTKGVQEAFSNPQTLDEGGGDLLGSGTAANVEKSGITSIRDAVTQAGIDFDNGFATAVKENLEPVKEGVKSLGNAAIETFKTAIDSHSPSRETYKIGKDYLDGFTNALRDHKENVKTTGLTVGQAAMDGLKQGIVTKGQEAINAAQNAVNRVASIMAKVLKVKSPSKVTEEIGEYVSIGLANGISNKESLVNYAAEDLANNTVSVLDTARGMISDVLNSDDDAITITPVLDMDTLKQQAGGISGLLNRGSTLRVGEIKARTALLANDRNAAIQNGSANPHTSTVTNYNMTQNNYSPKALNRSEIYRQTRNQFSRLKGATQA